MSQIRTTEILSEEIQGKIHIEVVTTSGNAELHTYPRKWQIENAR